MIKGEYIGSQKYFCEDCGKEYNSKKGLKYHNDAYHNNKRHICDICNKSYNYQKSLKYHYDTVHEGIKPQPKQCICELCGKVFCNSQSLKNHVATIHDKKRCSIVTFVKLNLQQKIV